MFLTFFLDSVSLTSLQNQQLIPEFVLILIPPKHMSVLIPNFDTLWKIRRQVRKALLLQLLWLWMVNQLKSKQVQACRKEPKNGCWSEKNGSNWSRNEGPEKRPNARPRWSKRSWKTSLNVRTHKAEKGISPFDGFRWLEISLYSLKAQGLDDEG